MDLAMLAKGSENRRKGFQSVFVVLVYLAVALLSFAGRGRCQDLDGVDNLVIPYESESPEDIKASAEAVLAKIYNISNTLGPDMLLKFGFCVKDVQTDWDRAFNFSGNITFVQDCIKQTKGDMLQRVCNAAEMKFYFTNMLEGGSKDMKPNKNCNLSTWLAGCEPGWACAVASDHAVDLKNVNLVPVRTRECQACCGGFFCPHGLTCMIPCPRGSYCPRGTPNQDTGYCDPYKYKLPQGQPNHTCGGADYWADIKSSREVFCSAGSYCPTTVEKLQCSRGY